jgi:hypothetical protein
MDKTKIFKICYLIGMFLFFLLIILMCLITFTKIEFDENKFIETLIIGGIALVLISPKDMFHGQIDTENNASANFSYTNFRGYFTCFLGLVSIILYIYLKVYIVR